MCGVSMGFHYFHTKWKCYILHHSQVAKEWSLNPFLHVTPEPQELGPVTSLLEPDSPISPRALQTAVELGCCVPRSFLWSLSFSTYFTPAYADT